MLENIQFLNIEFFWLLLLLPIAIIWYVFTRNKQTAELKMSSIQGFKNQHFGLNLNIYFLRCV